LPIFLQLIVADVGPENLMLGIAQICSSDFIAYLSEQAAPLALYLRTGNGKLFAFAFEYQ
jgi:hypothetical protein